MGVNLYELIHFKMPITSKYGYQGIHPSTHYFSDGWSAESVALQSKLFEKDPEKRPSIYEIVEMPYVRKYIDIFIKEHGCSNLINNFLPNPDL